MKSLCWIPSACDISDALTKGLISKTHDLIKLMGTKYLDVKKLGGKTKYKTPGFEKEKGKCEIFSSFKDKGRTIQTKLFYENTLPSWQLQSFQKYGLIYNSTISFVSCFTY